MIMVVYKIINGYGIYMYMYMYEGNNILDLFIMNNYLLINKVLLRLFQV